MSALYFMVLFTSFFFFFKMSVLYTQVCMILTIHEGIIVNDQKKWDIHEIQIENVRRNELAFGEEIQ